MDNGAYGSCPDGSEILVESRETGDWVEVAVKDQGIGMSDEEQEKLFTRFYRAKNDRTTQITGTGLGLYLTKFFIEAHHGRVEVLSSKNIGSTFKIILPLTQAGAESQVKRPAPGKFKKWFESQKKEKEYV